MSYPENRKSVGHAGMSLKHRDEFNEAYAAWERRRYGRRIERDFASVITADCTVQAAKNKSMPKTS